MLLILGAQKSATSTLTSLLTRAGVVFLEDSTMFEGPEGLLDGRLRDALNQARERQASKKASLGLAICRPNLLARTDSHERLRRRIPNARIVVVLRNPVERTVSAYFHYMRDGALPVRSLDDGLMKILEGFETSPRASEIVTYSQYGQGLSSLVTNFGREALLAVPYESLIAEPFAWVERIVEFSDEAPPSNLHDRLQRGSVPRLQETPSTLADILIQRGFRSPARGGDTLLADLRDYVGNPEARQFSGKSMSVRTFVSLWSRLLPSTTDIPRAIGPDWAPRVKAWMSDLSMVDASMDFSLNTLAPHPKRPEAVVQPPTEYCIGLVMGPTPFDLKAKNDELLSGKEAFSPRSRFAADPFIFSREGEHFVFYESRVSPKAIIEVATIDDDGQLTPIGVALEEPFHLSYPHVFRDGEDDFMLVESAEAAEMRLYRASEFPLSWELHRVLAQGRFADPTMVVHEGHRYIFTGRAGTFEIYNVVGDFDALEPHPANPIPVDSQHVRMGGSIIRHAGHLFRPSQRNRPTYGYCLDLHRIDMLTPTEYAESVEFSPFLPRPGQFDDQEWTQLIHHISLLNVDGGYFGVIDGRDQPGLFRY